MARKRRVRVTLSEAKYEAIATEAAHAGESFGEFIADAGFARAAILYMRRDGGGSAELEQLYELAKEFGKKYEPYQDDAGPPGTPASG